MRMDISHMVNAQITLCLNAHPGDMFILVHGRSSG